MSDFFKKLNVLVKAGLNDLLDVDLHTSKPALTPDKLGKNIDAEVRALRQRVNEALDYEDHLVARVQQLQAEVEQLDAEADQAVEAGRDAEARQLVQRLQALRQRLSMAEADLQDHRAVTGELILRVNELEAAVADAQQRQPDNPAEAPLEKASRVVADVLQEMRERIAELSAMTADPEAAPQEKKASAATDEQAVDDDLARRLDRLSKK
jgi:phage shock protein A